MLLALREFEGPLAVLAGMLEFDLIDNPELHVHIVTALNASVRGRELHSALLERKEKFRQIVRPPRTPYRCSAALLRVHSRSYCILCIFGSSNCRRARRSSRCRPNRRTRTCGAC